MDIAPLVSSQYFKISTEAGLQSALEIISQNCLEGILVVDLEGNPLGCLTPYMGLNGNPNRLVCDVMKELVRVPVDTKIERMLEIFRESRRGFALAEDKQGKIVGTISEKAILSYLFKVNSYFHDLWELSEYECKNTHDTLTQILKTVARHIEVEATFIAQLQGGQFWIRAIYGLPEKWEGMRIGNEQLSWCPCSATLKNKGPLIIQDISQDPRFESCFLRKEVEYKSFLGIPICRLPAAPLGILVICSVHSNKFGDLQIKLASVLVPRIREELEREKNMIQLLQTDRLANMGALSSGMVHNFNNVIQCIVGCSEILQEQGSQISSEEQEAIRVIVDSAQKATCFSKELLSSLRISNTLQRVEIHSILEILFSVIRNTFPKNIKISSEMPAEEVFLMGNPGQLYHAILNLCINAKDAMPDGGKIGIVVRKVFDHPDVSIPRTSDGYAMIEVSDTGVGFAPHLQKRIWEPFFTTKPEGKGTGLGLFTVQNIVKEHNGILDVSSRVGKGSIFRMYIPLQSVTDELSQKYEETEGRSVPSEQTTILIIEDNDTLRHLAKRVLVRYRYKVLDVATGEEAMSLIDSDSISLVVMDINLPGVSGEKLAYQVREKKKSLKILLVSGMSHDEEIENMLKLGNIRFLQKPYTNKAFLEAVENLLKERIS